MADAANVQISTPRVFRVGSVGGEIEDAVGTDVLLPADADGVALTWDLLKTKGFDYWYEAGQQLFKRIRAEHKDHGVASVFHRNKLVPRAFKEGVKTGVAITLADGSDTGLAARSFAAGARSVRITRDAMIADLQRLVRSQRGEIDTLTRWVEVFGTAELKAKQIEALPVGTVFRDRENDLWRLDEIDGLQCRIQLGRWGKASYSVKELVRAWGPITLNTTED